MDPSGSFQNILGGETWVEAMDTTTMMVTYQECTVPLSPHDGTGASSHARISLFSLPLLQVMEHERVKLHATIERCTELALRARTHRCFHVVMERERKLYRWKYRGIPWSRKGNGELTDMTQSVRGVYQSSIEPLFHPSLTHVTHST